MGMVKLWTPPGSELPVCAYCVQPTWNPHAHHLFVQSHKVNGLWNIVPVCNEAVSDCHARHAHGGGKMQVIFNTYAVWGAGDLEAGRCAILEEATRKIWAPEVRTVLESLDLSWNTLQKRWLRYWPSIGRELLG